MRFLRGIALSYSGMSCRPFIKDAAIARAILALLTVRQDLRDLLTVDREYPSPRYMDLYLDQVGTPSSSKARRRILYHLHKLFHLIVRI